MTNKKTIDAYLNDLSRALNGLPEKERADITDEIRGHLQTRAEEGRLDDTIRALGSPKQCAQGFYEQRQIEVALREGGVARTISALVTFATKRVLAAIGLVIASVLFTFSAAFGCIAIAKIVVPQHVGLWLSPDNKIYRLGFTTDPPTDGVTEVLGMGMIPFSIILAVGGMVAGHSIGRFFLGQLKGTSKHLQNGT